MPARLSMKEQDAQGHSRAWACMSEPKVLEPGTRTALGPTPLTTVLAQGASPSPAGPALPRFQAWNAALASSNRRVNSFL